MEGTVNPNGLTDKQELFCIHYVANNGNATQAAQEAGYTENYNVLRSIASENLTKPNIVKRIYEIRKELNLNGLVTVEWIQSQLKEVAQRSLQQQAATDEDGNIIGDFRYDAPGANKALELLGKMHGAFVDRTEITGKDGEKLQTVIYLPANGREEN